MKLDRNVKYMNHILNFVTIEHVDDFDTLVSEQFDISYVLCDKDNSLNQIIVVTNLIALGYDVIGDDKKATTIFININDGKVEYLYGTNDSVLLDLSETDLFKDGDTIIFSDTVHLKNYFKTIRGEEANSISLEEMRVMLDNLKFEIKIDEIRNPPPFIIDHPSIVSNHIKPINLDMKNTMDEFQKNMKRIMESQLQIPTFESTMRDMLKFPKI